MLVSLISLVASCLGNDNYGYTYYSDTAITGFSLGTLNRFLTTTSSTGEDSVYTTTITGSDYKFYIDQLSHEIYNPDSLPVGTDAEHVVCTIYSKNAGTVLIKNVDSDTLNYFLSTDSIDFTTPREFQVVSSDGSAVRKYIVSVNVHEEYPDSFQWNLVGTSLEFTTLNGMKALGFNSKMLVFGSDGNTTKIYSSEIENTPSWTELSLDVALDDEAYENVILSNDTLWTISKGELLYSSDGVSWQEKASSDGISKLLGAGTKKLYALSTDGRFISSLDKGLSWQKDDNFGDEMKIPTKNLNFATIEAVTNKDTERIIVAGNRDENTYKEDSVAMVWNKIEEYGQNSESHSWFLCNEQNGFELPRLENMRMLKYGEVLVAIGGHALGTSTAEAFSKLYSSEDSGLTWHGDTSYILPTDLTNNGSDVFGLAIDENNYLWIICGGDGQIWRGRINKMGWEENQTSFVE